MLPYIQGPMGTNSLCQPTSVKVSMARSHVGLMDGESMFPPRFFIAL